MLIAASAGVAGALALMALNEYARKLDKRAPHLDLLGEHALARGYRLWGTRPRRRTLERRGPFADLALHSAYYALVTRGKPNLARGLTAGLWGGLASLIAAPAFGQSRQSSSVRALTASFYLVGGVFAAAMAKLLAPKHRVLYPLRTPTA
jgi:hypothetical protein